MRRSIVLRSREETVSVSPPDRALSKTIAAGCGALLLFALATTATAASDVGVVNSSLRFNAEPIMPLPLQLTIDPHKRELGRRLFFDPRLSGDGQSHCGSCHALPPIAEGEPLDGVSPVLGKHQRSVPLLYNVGAAYWLNWDGRYSELDALVDAAIADPDKMNANWDAVLARLQPVYGAEFAELTQRAMLRRDVVEMLGVFLQSLNTPNARLDRFLRGDPEALSEREQEGYRFFKEVGCATCHNGRAVGGNFFEQFYIYRHQGGTEGESRLKDQGRYYVTGGSEDANLYRVPSLRNVIHSAPYFHDGSSDTLQSAIEEMAEHQLGVDLSEAEVELLADFLKTLTGSHPGVAP